MKALCLALLMSCFLSAVIAQQNSSPDNKLWQFDPAAGVTNNNIRPQANLIDESGSNKIYALPQDNMPCVVAPAATAALMPVAAKNFNNINIPNGSNKFYFMLPIKPGKIRSRIKKNKTPFTVYKPITSHNLMMDLIKKK